MGDIREASTSLAGVEVSTSPMGRSGAPEGVFGSLSRTDQRRWADLYVRGLRQVPGRKSLRRIAELTGLSGADQSLQQFVNQSPWDPRPVREALAAQVMEALRPKALVVHEVAFTKNGRFSPGVERQFVRSLGRVSNCQLALSVSASNGTCSLPLDWHLMLPASWNDDHGRRARAHVPDGEHHRPRWQHIVQVLDDICEWPATPDVPVVVDATAPAEAASLLKALKEHCHNYVLKVPGSTAAGRLESPRAAVPRGLPGGPVPPRDKSLTDVARSCADAPRHTIAWKKPDGGMCRTQFLTVLIDDRGPESPRPAAPPQRLLVQWPSRQSEPTGYWLTNLTHHSLPDLVELAMAEHAPRHTVESMGRDFGLWDFEGRSFRGWHHHVTLTSVAYGRHLLEEAVMVRPRRELLPEQRVQRSTPQLQPARPQELRWRT